VSQEEKKILSAVEIARGARGALPERLRTLLETLRDDARTQRFEGIAAQAAALLEARALTRRENGCYPGVAVKSSRQTA
jgi:hypothetical protein